jgi:ER-bound oxygenase mpaB/B'/Rubber oxygenase, catalytic domain
VRCHGTSESPPTADADVMISLFATSKKGQRRVWGWPIKFPQYHLPQLRLEELRLVGDDFADACLMKTALSEELLCAPETYTTQLSEELLCDPSLTRFLSHVQKMPEWLDWDLLRHGQQVFLLNSSSCALGLLYFSLIGGFSAPRITKVLDSTNYLTSESQEKTYRRLFETLEMVIDCVTGGLDTMKVGKRGFMSVLRVRFLHCRVRRRLMSAPIDGLITPTWDVNQYGVPINQEDLLATLLSFSVNVVETMFIIGVPVTDHDITAYLHLWKYIGYLMGIDQASLHLLDSYETARGGVESIVLHLLHPDDRSGVIARNCLLAVSRRRPFFWTYSQNSCMARFLLGKQLCDALSIKESAFLSVDYIYIAFVLLFIRLYAWFLFYLCPSSWKNRIITRTESILRRSVQLALRKNSANVGPPME